MRYINIGTPETGNGNPTPHEMGCYDHTFCRSVLVLLRLKVCYPNKWRCGVCGVCVHITGSLCPITAHFGAIMPETLGESTPSSPTAGAGAQKRKAQ